jgi:hypothetical protein
MTLTPEEVKELRAEETAEKSAEKAAQYKAEKESAVASVWISFLANHTGTRGMIRKNVFHATDANVSVFQGFMESRGTDQTDLAAVEAAWQAAAAAGAIHEYRLTEAQQEGETVKHSGRISNSQGPICDQVYRPSFPLPPLPYSRGELRKIFAGNDTGKMRRILQEYGSERVDAVLNSIS